MLSMLLRYIGEKLKLKVTLSLKGVKICVYLICVYFIMIKMNKHYPPLVQWPTQLCDIVFVSLRGEWNNIALK